MTVRGHSLETILESGIYMQQIGRFFTSNFFMKRLTGLSTKKKFVLFLCALLGLVPSMVCFMIPKLLYDQPAAKALLFFSTFCLGYICWCVLFSCLSNQRAQNILANLALIFIPIALLVNSWNVNQRLLKPDNFQLLNYELAPCGDHAAEAYVVSKNEDGSFWGRIYLSYPETGANSEYKNMKTQIFEDKNLRQLQIEWLDDRILLVNGEEIDTDNVGWHFP